MKTLFVLPILLGAALVSLSANLALADDTTNLAAAPATGTADDTGQNGQRMEKLKAALAQLDLTDAQKEQIKQIRATVTDKKERRQQIMGVLTPDQKAKLIEMIKEHREAAGGAAATAPTAN